MKALSAAFLLALAIGPAAATEWMTCSAGEGGGSADLLMGAMNVVAIADARIEAGGKKFSTRPEAADEAKVTVGQAFEDSTQLLVDFTDESVDGIVARLRLWKASEGEDHVSGGTLQVTGVGAWAVNCPNP